MKKLIYFILGASLFIGASSVFAVGAFPVATGGTGSTTLTGILSGNGTSPVKTVVIGAGCTFVGGILACSGVVATSSVETANQVPWWTSTSAGTALLSGGDSTFLFDPTNKKLSFTNGSTTALSATGEIYATGGNAVTTNNFCLTSTCQTGLYSNGGNASLATGGTGVTWGSLSSVISWYPNSDNARNLGGSSNRWLNLWLSGTATTTTLCLSTDCRTSWPTGTVTSIVAGAGLNGGTISSSGTFSLISYLATSSAETAGQLAAWGTTNGTPAKLYSTATSSISVSAGLTNSGTLGNQVGGTALTLKQVENRGFSYATTTAWTGTTTISLGVGYNEVWNNIKCYTDVGTLAVDFYHASTHFNYIASASTTIGVNAQTGTDTSGDKVKVDIGNPASSPTVIACTVNDTN